MSTCTKRWLIAAALLISVGGILFAAVMTVYHWDFSRLSTERFETNIHEISKEFHDISIGTETADILFAVSDDSTCRVVCYEQTDRKHSVAVQDDTLTVHAQDRKGWVQHIGISFHTPKVTVYLPKTEYGALNISGITGDIEIAKEFRFSRADISVTTGNVNLFASVPGSVKIKTTTGSICAEKISADALELSASTGGIRIGDVTSKGDIRVNVTTGDVKAENVTCLNLITGGSTGDILLKRVLAKETLSAERSTGDVVLESSDAGEIHIKTGTGSVTGTLLSDKVFLAESSAGRIKVPKTAAGGKCEITTSTGEIRIEIAD